MGWILKDEDEVLDLIQARHYAIFRNTETKAEHHLISYFADSLKPPIDFEKAKADTLKALNDHHRQLMEYRAKHSRVRVLKP